MASTNEKTEALDTNQKRNDLSRSDASAVTPVEAPGEAAPEPKPDQPAEQDGWSAYWVSDKMDALNGESYANANCRGSSPLLGASSIVYRRWPSWLPLRPVLVSPCRTSSLASLSQPSRAMSLDLRLPPPFVTRPLS